MSNDESRTAPRPIRPSLRRQERCGAVRGAPVERFACSCPRDLKLKPVQLEEVSHGHSESQLVSSFQVEFFGSKEEAHLKNTSGSLKIHPHRLKL